MRAALGRLIVQQINGRESELPVITLDMSLERILQQSLETTGSSAMAIEPNLANNLLQSLREAHEQREIANQPSVLLVADNLREFLARFARPAIRGLYVLGFNEVPNETQLRVQLVFIDHFLVVQVLDPRVLEHADHRAQLA